MPSCNLACKRFLPFFLALAVTLSSTPLALAFSPIEAHVPDADASITGSMVDQIHTGSTVSAGNYYNTPGNATTFVNGSYLHLPGGTLHGFEVTVVGAGFATTGNGGSFVFSAPLVRLDGNVDVSGFMKGGTLGNGGTVIIHADYLYQNGHIFANGANGGLIQFNVGGMTVARDVRIEAKGLTGEGGRIYMGYDGTTNGVVNIRQGAIVDSSGLVIGNYDTNLIRVEGGLINLNGILRANGIQDSSGNGTQGGQIVLVSHGNTQALNAAPLQSSGVFSAGEISQLVNRDANLIANNDGNIRLGVNGKVITDGADAIDNPVPGSSQAGNGGNGGQIFLASARNIVNNGVIKSNGGNGGDAGGIGVNPAALPGNGGNGGQVTLRADNDIRNNGEIKSDGGNGGSTSDSLNPATRPGQGGNGGFMTLWAEDDIVNNGDISAKGGNGGDNDTNAVGSIGTVIQNVPTLLSPSNTNAATENKDFNGLTNGASPAPASVPAIISNVGGGTLTIPGLTVTASRAGNGQVTLTIRQNGVTIFEKIQSNGSDFSENNLNLPLTGTFTVPGLAAQTVTLTRDTKVSINFVSNNARANVNLTFRPQLGDFQAVVPTEVASQTSTGGPGGNGGSAGMITLNYGDRMRLNNDIIVQGGKGGNGGDATATSNDATIHQATGGQGGNAGGGGLIFFTGPNQPTNTSYFFPFLTSPYLKTQAGDPGDGGTATVARGGNATNGAQGFSSFDGAAFGFPVIGGGGCEFQCEGEDPRAPGIPDGPTPPVGPQRPSVGTVAAETTDSDTRGLFQEHRPDNPDLGPPTTSALLISMNNGRMYLARSYRSVTQEILALAVRHYNSLISNGYPAGNAAEDIKASLRQSGVDAETAQALLDQIQAGTLQADPLIVKLLEEMASAKAAVPASP